MEFQNKVCIVTGGGHGIGKCIVENFAKEGAKVIVIDKIKQEEIENVFYYYGDLAKQTVIEDFVSTVIQRFNTVDYLINNACFSNKGIISKCSYNDFLEVLQVGVAAPYYLTQLLFPHFNKDASIVNISSTRSMMSQADTESYTSAKGGVQALTHALSISLAGKARVNAISPGWIETNDSIHSKEDNNQHPVKRVGVCQDIANMVLYLCSSKAGFITGQDFVIDGGMTKQMIYHDDEGWTFAK